MASKKAASKKVASKKARASRRPAKKAAAKTAAAKAPSAKKRTAAKKASSGAKKKTAARVTPKVSPLRGTSVDAWAERLSGWHADALRLIRALVVRHAPEASLSIKWGQPVWDHNGPFAWAKPAGGHLSFGFWRGAELADPKGVLEGSGSRMRHVKIRSIDDVSRLPLEAFVKEAVRLNARNGDPTKRG